MTALSRIHVFLSGRVQGVAFRYFAQRQAVQMNITGWVKNLYDGRVEVLAEGRKDDLERFLDELGRGPRLSKVDNVNAQWEDPTGEFDDFRVEFSAF